MIDFWDGHQELEKLANKLSRQHSGKKRKRIISIIKSVIQEFRDIDHNYKKKVLRWNGYIRYFFEKRCNNKRNKRNNSSKLALFLQKPDADRLNLFFLIKLCYSRLCYIQCYIEFITDDRTKFLFRIYPSLW